MPAPQMFRMIALPDVVVELVDMEAELRTAAGIKDEAVVYRRVGRSKATVRKKSEFLRMFEPLKK